MKFFLEKQLINFYVPISTFHSAESKKNSYNRSRVMRISHFRAQNGPFILNNFSWYKPLLLRSSTYWPFSLCKIQENFLQRIQNYEDVPFWGPKWSICLKQNFFWKKKLNIIFIYLLTPSKCTKFLKNSYSGSRVMRMCHFGGQNGPIAQMRIFFRKSVYEPCSFHSCLSTYQKSKSDINL